MKQPRLIPAEMMHEVRRPEQVRPDLFIIIAFMRGSWYMPRFAERLYTNGETAVRDAEAFADDESSPYRNFKVVKIPGSAP